MKVRDAKGNVIRSLSEEEEDKLTSHWAKEFSEEFSGRQITFSGITGEQVEFFEAMVKRMSASVTVSKINENRFDLIIQVN